MGMRRSSSHWALRASDADREAVVDQLREHCAAGRLSMDEFEARLEETYAARTYRELAWVTRELPRLERRPRFAHLRLGRHALANGAVAVAAVAAVDAEVGLLAASLPVGAAAVSAAVLVVQHHLHLRRTRRGRRGQWQVVASDRWRAGVTPPVGFRAQLMGGSVPWDWRQPGPRPTGQWPGHQTSRPTGTGGWGS